MMLLYLRKIDVTVVTVFILSLFCLSQPAWAQETAVITDTRRITQSVPISGSDSVSRFVEVRAFMRPINSIPQTYYAHEATFLMKSICTQNWYAPAHVSNHEIQQCEQTRYLTDSQSNARLLYGKLLRADNNPDVSGIDIELGKVVSEDEVQYTLTDLPFGEYTVVVDLETPTISQDSVDFAYPPLPDTYSIDAEPDSIHEIVEDYSFIYLDESDVLTVDTLAIRFRVFTITDTITSWDLLTNTVSTDEMNVPLSVSTHFIQATHTNGRLLSSASTVFMLGLCLWYLKIYRYGRGR